MPGTVISRRRENGVDYDDGFDNGKPAPDIEGDLDGFVARDHVEAPHRGRRATAHGAAAGQVQPGRDTEHPVVERQVRPRVDIRQKAAPGVAGQLASGQQPGLDGVPAYERGGDEFAR